MRIWWISNLLGIALEKIARWLRWRSRLDFM